jgi:hypothetical protein
MVRLLQRAILTAPHIGKLTAIEHIAPDADGGDLYATLKERFIYLPSLPTISW